MNQAQEELGIHAIRDHYDESEGHIYGPSFPGYDVDWLRAPLKELVDLPGGSVAVLAAMLQRIVRVETRLPNALQQEYEAMNLALGDISADYENEESMAYAKATRDAYRAKGLWDDSPAGWGLRNFSPFLPMFEYYGNKYFVAAGVKAVFAVFGYDDGYQPDQLMMAATQYAQQRSAKYILNRVVLPQARFVLDAIEDGYPTLYLEAPAHVQNDPDVQVAAGIRGVAPAALAALRSLLLATGAEQPGLLRRFVNIVSRRPAPHQGITLADALNDTAASLARANPDNAQVVELAQRLSGFLYRLDGSLRKRDLDAFLADNERGFGWEASGTRDAGGKLYPELATGGEVEDEGEYALEPGRKRHRAATASLESFFGRRKVEHMRLFVHAVRVASA